ncbi:hypothetical protein [Burkholderia gladioli]|uniref:hypothetical protein n=1 Tax=Burkholderia gladioli TaxID=28095 RepID=UPI0012D33E6C|nr:hypothetical protein [Burkholderia gladioli]
MCRVLVIGLLKSLENRFNIECKRKGIVPTSVKAEIGKRGNYVLIPHTGVAISELQAHSDAVSDYSDAYVIVMPYAELPENLEGELAALETYEARIVRSEAGRDGWPSVPKTGAADSKVLNDIYSRLWQAMPEVTDPDLDLVPSDYFRKICGENPHIIVADSVFKICDEVTAVRQKFLRRCMDALSDLTRKEIGTPIDKHFRSWELDCAGSGSLTSSVVLTQNSSVVFEETTEVHLKQGDKTKVQNSVRVYFHQTVIQNVRLVIITYAGQHPDRNMKWSGECPEVLFPRQSGTG